MKKVVKRTADAAFKALWKATRMSSKLLLLSCWIAKNIVPNFFLLLNLLLTLKQVYRVDLLDFFCCKNWYISFITLLNLIFIDSRYTYMQYHINVFLYDFKRPHLIIKIAILTSSVVGEHKKKFIFEMFFERYLSTIQKPAAISTPYCVYSRLFFYQVTFSHLKSSRIRSSCPSYPIPYMFIVRYWMSKCKNFCKDISTQRLKFINLSCCINQINEENREEKIILIKKKLKISSPPNNKPTKRLWYLTAVSFHYSKKNKIKIFKKKKNCFEDF